MDDDDEKTNVHVAGRNCSTPHPVWKGNIPFSKENTPFIRENNLSITETPFLIRLPITFFRGGGGEGGRRNSGLLREASPPKSR